jgi:hypothetical protein
LNPTDVPAVLAAAQSCEDGQIITAQARARAATTEQNQQQVQVRACGGEGLVGQVPDGLICQVSKIVDLYPDEKVVEAAWLQSKRGGGGFRV